MRPAERNVSSEAVSTTQSNKEMDKVLQAVEEQRKSIDHLSQTLISFSKFNNHGPRNPRGRGGRYSTLRGVDEHENRICYKCQGIGKTRECVNNTSQRHIEDPPPSTVMSLHALLPFLPQMFLIKIHQRQTVSLHSRESDSRRGRYLHGVPSLL